eukprot:TRINITY_DN22303_c0_g1_i1.p1 TRINITY_DN22303_c0_g1~~TRINITY_DN22303_c0_g1_i1.p1  ORF type:complete len:512 (+),score=57.94 TRINITY_DN22303_c0_g1_i1:1-1536(+)
MELNNDSVRIGENEKKKKKEPNRIVQILTSITIEPMTILSSLSGNIVAIPQDQMLLYKTCIQPKYNLSDEFCSNIEEYTNTSSYSDVEAEMSSFYNYISLAEHLIPIFISFYLGSWSDHYGRKPFIYISMTGFLVSSVMNLMNVIYLKEWDKWVWLASVILSKNVFGGGLGFVMVVYSFIADNSTDKQRTIRLAILSFTWHVTQPAGGPIGAWLLDSGGYVCVFSASLVVMGLSFLYMLLRLWNFQEKKKEKENLSVLNIIHPRHIKDSLSATFKPRPGHKRTYLIIMMTVMLLNMMPYIGEGAYQFLYVKRVFSWGVSEYSWYKTTASLVSSVAMFLLFPLFHRFKVNDNFIIILSCISQMGGAFVRGMATEPWIFYLSTIVDFGTSIVSPPIRAQITHCVEPHELGKIFAMLASVESLIPIIGTNMYTRIYNATRELAYPFPGSCYFASCGFIALGLILTTSVAFTLKCKKIPLLGEPKLERSNSNRHPEVKVNGEIFCQNYAYNADIW